LKQEQIKALKDMSPAPDEITQILDYVSSGQPVDMLGTTEKFYLAIAKIGRFEQRLGCWMFKNQFPVQFTSINPDIETVTSAVKELMGSEKLLTFLQIVLYMGNFLNTGKKGTYGFQMSSLLKLRDLKATGAKLNLLAYIYQYCQQKYPEVLDFTKDISHVIGATRVNLAVAKSEIGDLKKGIENIDKEVELSEGGPGDGFRAVMGGFLEDASDKVDLLEKGMNDLEKLQKDLCVYFGEDESKFQLATFLADLTTFLGQIEEVKLEEEKRKILEQKKKEADAKKEKKNAEKVDSPVVGDKKKKKKKEVEEEEGGVLDDLQSDLMDGSAFKKNKDRKKKLTVDSVLDKLKESNSDF